jgi:hypothetical protein
MPPGPSSYNDPYYARDRDMKDRDRDERDRERQNRDRDRGPDRDRGERDRAGGDRDRDRERTLDQRDPKRLKTERIKTDRPGIFFFLCGDEVAEFLVKTILVLPSVRVHHPCRNYQHHLRRLVLAPGFHHHKDPRYMWAMHRLCQTRPLSGPLRNRRAARPAL